MGTAYIRDIDDWILENIDKKADKAGLSRTKYIRTLLKNEAQKKDIFAVEEKYSSLVKMLGNIIIQNTKTMEMMNNSIIDLEEEVRMLKK